MNTSRPRLISIAQRTIDALPILLAMVFHAIAMERWLLIAPATIAVIYGVFRSSNDAAPISWTSRQWYGIVIAGLLLGLVIPAAEVSSGPLPPAGAAAMTGIAVSVSLFAVFRHQLTIGWVAAWAMVSISANMEMDRSLRIVLLGFLVASLVAASWHAGLLKNRLREAVVWGVFVAAIASSTFFLSLGITRVEQMFLGTIQRLVPNPTANATTGMSDSLMIGSKSTMHPTKQPLFELSQMPGPLRVRVMDEFRDNQWTTSSILKSQHLQIDGSYKSTAKPRSFEMLFLDDLDKSIPSPSGTLGIQNASTDLEGGWIWRGKPDGVAVTIHVDSSQHLPPETLSGSDLLAVPDEIREAFASFAAQLTPDPASSFSKARSIESFFHENFQYSLETDLSGDSHPLVTLIQERRPAYCAYFASAMALMLRTQGIPTRIVTGYAPEEANPLTGRVTVRSSDSHAWVEVWLAEENRYVAFDPTPSESRRQVMGLNESSNVFQAAFSAMRSTLRRLWLLIRYQPSSGIQTLLLSPILWIAISGLIWLWRKRSRRSMAKKQSTTSIPIDSRLRKQYDRYLAALRTAGVEARPSESDDELLARLRETGNLSLWEAANKFIQRYRDVRYGGEALEETQIEFRGSR